MVQQFPRTVSEMCKWWNFSLNKSVFICSYYRRTPLNQSKKEESLFGWLKITRAPNCILRKLSNSRTLGKNNSPKQLRLSGRFATNKDVFHFIQLTTKFKKNLTLWGLLLIFVKTVFNRVETINSLKVPTNMNISLKLLGIGHFTNISELPFHGNPLKNENFLDCFNFP